MTLWRAAAAIILSAVLLEVPAEASDAGQENGAEMTLRVTCRTDGKQPDDGSLTFVLWDEQHQILQQVVNLGGNASFAPLSFSSAGQYIFYITQEAGTSLAVAYDPAVYQIIIRVSEAEGRLSPRISEVNRVSGDPAGEVRILRTFGADAVPAFENKMRQIAVPPLMAEVPQTGDSTVLWLLAWVFSGVILRQMGGRSK